MLVFLFSVGALGQTTALPEQIKLMDRQWIIEAYSSRDLADFDRIVAKDFLITGGNGKVQTKAEKRSSVKNDYTDPSTTASPDYIFRIEPASHQVRVFDKTAVSNGYITEKYVWKGTPINNRVYFTNVYVKRNGKWQVVAAQFTNIKQS
jgi:hypothetical protein